MTASKIHRPRPWAPNLWPYYTVYPSWESWQPSPKKGEMFLKRRGKRHDRMTTSQTYKRYYYTTNSVYQRPSYDADRRSVGREIPSLLWKPNVHSGGDGMNGTELIRTEIGGGLFWRRVISWPAERLWVSQEKVCTMATVTYTSTVQRLEFLHC
jgi:hypothetical protein